MKRWIGLVMLAGGAGCGGSPFSAEDRLLGEAGVAEDSAVDVGLDDAQEAEAQSPDVEPDVGVEAAADGGAESGAHDATADAPVCSCVTSLSNIGLQDFYIAFTLTTTSTMPMSILNQRSACVTTLPFWDVYTGTNGAFSSSEGVVYINVGDGSASFDDVSTQKLVNDGQPHRIVIARLGGTSFKLTVDGTGGVQSGGPSNPLNATLPPLMMGTDVCSAYAPLSGQIVDVCISVGCPLQ
jgi:hypothetical protein